MSPNPLMVDRQLRFRGALRSSRAQLSSALELSGSAADIAVDLFVDQMAFPSRIARFPSARTANSPPRVKWRAETSGHLNGSKDGRAMMLQQVYLNAGSIFCSSSYHTSLPRPAPSTVALLSSKQRRAARVRPKPVLGEPLGPRSPLCSVDFLLLLFGHFSSPSSPSCPLPRLGRLPLSLSRHHSLHLSINYCWLAPHPLTSSVYWTKRIMSTRRHRTGRPVE